MHKINIIYTIALIIYKRNPKIIFCDSDPASLYVSRAWYSKFIRIEKNVIVDSINVNTCKRGYPYEVMNGLYETRINYLKSSKIDDRINFLNLEYIDNKSYVILYLNGLNKN